MILLFDDKTHKKDTIKINEETFFFKKTNPVGIAHIDIINDK
jgi:hypothetical protein